MSKEFRISELVRFFEDGTKLKIPSEITLPLIYTGSLANFTSAIFTKIKEILHKNMNQGISFSQTSLLRTNLNAATSSHNRIMQRPIV